MEIQLAAAATGVVLGFFQRVLSGASDQVADRLAGRVVNVLESLDEKDPEIRSVMNNLRRSPGDAQGGAQLQHCIEEATRLDPQFRTDLTNSMAEIDNRFSSSFVNQSGIVVGGGNKNKISMGNIKNIKKNSGAMWLLVGAALLAALIVLTCGGMAYALAREHTMLFDTKTDVQGAGGWLYRVSEAHLKTSPQLDDHGPAKPGYRYIYFDITVENILQDREAPGIQFYFARAAGSLSGDCGAEQVGFFGPVSSYAGGVIPGWCISKNGDMFSGGASCFETNDSFLHAVDNIPPGGRNQVRCVDSYLAKEGSDLSSLRVYYLGIDFVHSGVKVPNMKQIPTAI